VTTANTRAEGEDVDTMSGTVPGTTVIGRAGFEEDLDVEYVAVDAAR
jgi:hypothetical protein